MKKKIVLLTLLSFLFVGCSNGPSDVDPTVHVSSVSLDASSINLYTDDSTTKLNVSIYPEDASDKTVTWSTSDSSVATVTDGDITPIGVGTTTITVSSVDGNKTDQCLVTVEEPPVTIPNYVLHGLYDGNTTWEDKQMVLNPCSSTEYMICGVYLHADDIVKVHMYGNVWYGYSDIKSSVKPGLVGAAPTDNNIKIKYTGVYDIYSNYEEFEGGHIYIARTDEETPPPSTVSVTGISLSNSGKFLLVREEFTITPTVYPNNATNKEVIWTSSDTSIATVTSAGRVVASVNSKVGSTTITAKTVDGNFLATCLVYVSASQYPAYCLTGTVGGRSYSGLSRRYAAIPMSSGKYLIPDVELLEGDKITITDNYGARLKDKYNHVYEKPIPSNMSVNVYLDVNNASKDYLSFQFKSGN